MPGLVGPAKDCEKLTRRSCGMPDPVGPAHAGLSREHRTPRLLTADWRCWLLRAVPTPIVNSSGKSR